MNTENTAPETQLKTAEDTPPLSTLERLLAWTTAQDEAPCRRWSYEIEAVGLGNVSYELERLGFDTHCDPSVTGGEDCFCDCDECEHSCDCEYCGRADYLDHCGNCSDTEAAPKSNQPVITTHDSARLIPAMNALAGVARIDETCGGHLHIDAEGMSAQQIATVMRLWHKVNDLLPELIGREPNNYAELNDDWDERAILEDQPQGERYRAVNAVNWIQSKHGSYNASKNTLEFRQFAGTLNPRLIVARGYVCRALVEIATASKPIYWLARTTTPEAFLAELGINLAK